VILRRTIGLKKDEYSLDKKSATKTEVMNLLESAGFSSSNPYYIVPQGRITALCNSKDSERLTLLKEVAGTGVYETRRRESIKIMEETSLKRQKIDELMEFIEDRLQELESEKKELAEFTRLDKDRRCIEYAMYDRELTNVTHELDALEAERQSQIVTSNQSRDTVKEKAEQLDKLTRELEELRHELESVQIDRDGKSQELAQIQNKITELDLQIHETERMDSSKQKTILQKELDQVSNEIISTRNQINVLEPKYLQSQESEKGLQARHEEMEARRRALAAKQGRVGQFTSVAQRRAWLNKEIKKLEDLINQSRLSSTSILSSMSSNAHDIQQIEDEVTDLREQFSNAQTHVSELQAEHDQAINERNQFAEQRKKLWQSEAKAEATLSGLKEQVSKLERHIFSTTDKGTSLGLQCLKEIVNRLKLSGVHGPLYELMEVPESYRACVEAVGGSSIFHIVVDNEQIATTILQEMRRQKGSAHVTLMPLNRLRSKEVTYPKSQDCIPMISKIKFEAKYKKAFEQVFAKAVVCPDLQTASKVSRETGLDAVTIQGDRVDKRGAMSGGYVNFRKSRLEAALEYKQVKVKFDETKKESSRIKQEMIRLEQEVTSVISKIQQIQMKQQRSRDETIMSDWQNKKKRLDLLNQTKVQLMERHDRIEQEIRNYETQIESLKTEVKSSDSKLTSEEQHELTLLETQIAQNRQSWNEQSRSMNEYSSQLSKLRSLLDHNLILKQMSLQRDLLIVEQTLQAQDLSQLRVTQKEHAKAYKASSAELTAIESTLDKLSTDISKKSAKIDEVKQAIKDRQRTIEQQELSISRFIQHRKVLSDKKEEVLRNIRELGVLPDNFQKYHETNISTLVRNLRQINDQLKKYSHVNKKAIEQYNNFTKQREQLDSRKRELDESAQSIQNLLNVLDQRKNEAIQRTFKNVSQNFHGVFEELVPAGKGSLVMVYSKDETLEPNGDTMEVDLAEDPDSTAGQAFNRVDAYRGVSVQVSFNSKVDEGLKMQQLSGGQKSLVALALIFAIQQCDPAPFYLFDEIDANLDAQYRTAVAALLNRLSESAQFICTTFRPELLTHADKFYGVTFHNKTSKIQCISKEDALGFVELGQRETTTATEIP
jgi:structural maintenance of chromosome 3 (chondroitin sulfate proteoglycan 6)